MKFAHLADCHIGSWRDPRLRELGIKSFEKAIDTCIKEHVAFILISGDLFNTSLPSIDFIKETAAIINNAKEHDISIYIIPGSHDYSPSNKTMLDVLEKAGLVENVAKFEEDKDSIKLKFTIDKTSTKITGIYGKRSGLDRFVYQKLNKEPLEKEPGLKIFMFHCGITEFKTIVFEKLDFESISAFPKNFDYYAGGHIHYIFEEEVPGYGLFAFPGPLFPNNFEELETLKNGSFIIADVNKSIKIKRIPIKFYDTISFDINVNNLTPEQASSKILKSINKDIENKIVTLRISGILSSGKTKDIDFKEIYSRLEKAYVVLKNTNKLSTKEYEELKIETGSITDVESKLIAQFSEVMPLLTSKSEDELLINDLIRNLSLEKNEAEKTAEFEARLISNAVRTIKIEDLWETKNDTKEY